MIEYMKHFVARFQKGALFLSKAISQRLLLAVCLVVFYMLAINNPQHFAVNRDAIYQVSENDISERTAIILRNIYEEKCLDRIANLSNVSESSVLLRNVTEYLGQTSSTNNASEYLDRTTSLRNDKTLSHPEEEVRHIGFLKVHKAASSTIQNILFRFGLKRNLTFVFTTHPNYFSRSPDTNIPLVKPRYRSGYDILCNHGIFNHSLYSSILPVDSSYIAIVRDPLDVFISGVNYYSQQSKVIRYIVETPVPRIRNLIRYPEKYDKAFFSFSKNIMARDFGFLPTSEKKYIDQKLEELDEIFSVVLIVEYFEESLILMKRFLNWKLQDIIFMPNNVFGKGESVRDLTPNDIKKFERRNNLDYLVYNKFLDKFWAMYKSEPDDIHQEVIHFKQNLKYVAAFCDGKAKNITRLIIQDSPWNEKFELNKQECDLIQEEEMDMIQTLRKIQGSELEVQPKVRVYRRRRSRRLELRTRLRKMNAVKSTNLTRSVF